MCNANHHHKQRARKETPWSRQDLLDVYCLLSSNDQKQEDLQILDAICSAFQWPWCKGKQATTPQSLKVLYSRSFKLLKYALSSSSFEVCWSLALQMEDKRDSLKTPKGLFFLLQNYQVCNTPTGHTHLNPREKHLPQLHPSMQCQDLRVGIKEILSTVNLASVYWMKGEICFIHLLFMSWSRHLLDINKRKMRFRDSFKKLPSVLPKTGGSIQIKQKYGVKNVFIISMIKNAY